MQLLSLSTLLVLTSCLALLPFHGLAQSWLAVQRATNQPSVPYPANYNAATCPRDRSNTVSLSLMPDTGPSTDVRMRKRITRAVIAPRARSGALPDVCRQTDGFFFPALPNRYLRIALSHFLPGNVYVFSIRTPPNKRIEEISARTVGASPPQDRLLDISHPMSNVGTLQMVVQARAEVMVKVVFEDGNTPGEAAIFVLGGVHEGTVANA